LHLMPTPHQRPAITWVSHYRTKQRLRHAAARIIQLIWRRRQLMKPWRDQLSVPFIRAVNDFRQLQRTYNSLTARAQEARPTATLDERIGSVEQNMYIITSKLDRILQNVEANSSISNNNIDDIHS